MGVAFAAPFSNTPSREYFLREWMPEEHRPLVHKGQIGDALASANGQVSNVLIGHSMKGGSSIGICQGSSFFRGSHLIFHGCPTSFCNGVEVKLD